MKVRTVRRMVRDILSLTYVAGNGGYVADIGPTTFGMMCEFVDAPEFDRIEDLRAWASGAPVETSGETA